MKRVPPIIACVVTLAVLVWFLSYHNHQFSSFSFVDARVYRSALSVWLSGSDPYQHSNPASFMNFLYPPFFLYVGGFLARFVPMGVISVAYAAAHIVAALSTPWIIYRYYIQKSKWPFESFYLLYLLTPGLSFPLAIDTGNIAVIAFALILSAGALGLRRQNWLLFYLILFFFAAIKPTYLPLLLLPVLCGKRQILAAGACGALSLIGLKTQAWLDPSLFASFQRSLAHQSLSLGDVGQGIFGISFHVLHKAHHTSMLLPLVLYGAVAVVVLLLAWRARAQQITTADSHWPAIVLLAVLFTMVRIQYYDLCFGCPIAIFLTAERLGRWGFLLLYAVIATPAFYFRFCMPYTALDGGFEAMASLVLLCVILLRLQCAWRASAMSELTPTNEVSVHAGH